MTKATITIHDFDQGSEDWHNIRDGKYTGTGAEKLLAHPDQIKIVDGVASAYALTEITGFTGNFYTKRGHILEEEAIELYEAIRGISVDRPGFVTNSAYPTCGYSPDGLTETAVIEVKCFKEDKHLQMFNGNIPLKVLAQIHFGMLICGKKLAHLLIYNPDLEAKQAFKVIEIKTNRNISSNFKRILAAQGATA